MLLKSLSIQQPYAELIMRGRERVENRSWTWLKEWDWAREGPLLLGIHASSKLADVAEERLDEWFPDKKQGEPLMVRIGCVVGVVDLVNICRPAELPSDLRDHEFVNRHPDNWCWVLRNPRRLAQTLAATGNARLFHVDVPDELFPAGVPGVLRKRRKGTARGH